MKGARHDSNKWEPSLQALYGDQCYEFVLNPPHADPRVTHGVTKQ